MESVEWKMESCDYVLWFMDSMRIPLYQKRVIKTFNFPFSTFNFPFSFFHFSYDFCGFVFATLTRSSPMVASLT